MTIQIDSGTRLGSYEIVSRIGAGGMGEVWRARDSQIGRDVAIKVLPVSVAENADRLHRFELEARAAGTLNHPNLVTIFELGKHDGAPFIVMELLEGETLREKIDEGTIPPRKAIEYSVQMANGLAAAHEKGIVHRDLKPENVIITADGRLKILDFGLAKLTTPEQTADDKTARRDTAPGTVMGTAGYMSPEQVRGQQIDHRTDIFSFGAILYEMVSGRPAFKRDSSVETMNAILKEDPPEMSVSGHHGSLATERIIHRCLEKNATERFQSARDLSFALESLSSNSSGHESALLAAPAHSSRKRLMALGAVAAAALMALFFFLGRSSRPQPGQPIVRQLTFRNGTIRSARFAPDGQTIVYGAAWDGAPLKMFQRRLEGSESVPLEFPDADLLGISSKGELAISLGRTFRNWTNNGALAKAPLLGSSFRKVLDDVSWADWHPSGDGLLVVRRVGSEDRLEYPIGKVLYRTAGFITYPRFSPKGDRVAFLDHPSYGDNRGNVSILTLGGKKIDMLLDWAGLEGLSWSPSGDEVWFTGSRVNGGWSIYAVHEGAEPRPIWRTPSNLVLHDVDRLGRVLVANAAIVSTIRGLGRGEQHERDLSFGGWSVVRDMSTDGKNALLVNYGGDAGRYYDTYLRPLNGAAPTRLGEGEPLGFSRDGKWVLASIITAQQKLFLYGTESESSRDIGNYSSVATAAWFPDGRRLMLMDSTKPGLIDCYVQDIDSGKRSRLPIENARAGLPIVSPDGLEVAIVEGGAATRVYSLRGQLLREVPASYRPIAWSSDSRFLYVHSPGEMPVKIQRLEVASGIMTPWKEIVSVDTSGMLGPLGLNINSDGDAYTYTVTKMITDLFIVEGLR